MKGMEGRAGKKTVFSEPTDEDAEGYAADVSMVAPSEEASTPVVTIGSDVPSTNGVQDTSAKRQKQSKRVASLVKAASTPSTSPRPHSSTRPRFTAPSSLDSLPPNMFVTSVYFPWPHGKKPSKPKDQRQKDDEQEESYAADQSVVEQDPATSAAVPNTTPSNGIEAVATPTPTAARGSALQTEREKRRRAFLLGKEYVPPVERQEDDPDHAEEDAVDAQMNGHSLPKSIGQQADKQLPVDAEDWDHAEAEWERLNVIATDTLEKVVEGTILAWKVSAHSLLRTVNPLSERTQPQALEMDFTTFTPEIKVKLGRVTVVKRSTDTPDRLYQIRVLVRPDGEGTDEQSEDVENLAVDMNGISSGEYRVLR